MDGGGILAPVRRIRSGETLASLEVQLGADYRRYGPMSDAGELMILDEQGKFIGNAEAPFPFVVRAFMGNQLLGSLMENGRLFVFDIEKIETP